MSLKKKRRRRRNLARPEALGEVIAVSSEARFAKVRPPLSARVWQDAVGARIADRSDPFRLESNVLWVRVATHTWATELSLLSRDILARLVAKGIAVRELRFKVGEIRPPERPIERRESRKVPPPAKLPPALAANIDAVADDELREALRASAAANLAWQSFTQPSPPAPRSPNAAPPSARVPRDAETRSAPSDRSSGRKP